MHRKLAITGRRHPRGMAVVYIGIMMVAMLGLASLAVDFARFELTKTELHDVADAAALYGVSGLATSVTEASNRAIASAAENKAAATAVVLTTSDIEFGSWNPDTRVFTALSGSARSAATAMRITARRANSRNTSVPTMFACALGFKSFDVSASAIATRGQVVSETVNADSCPWLAGMSSGGQVAGYGGNTTAAVAPAQSPCQVTDLPIVAGQKLSFQKASGQTSYADAADYGPDGNTGWIVAQQPANGINTTYAPLNCLVGIFLDDRAPNTYAQASTLDFTTDDSRNFQTLSPGIKQVFFIGDGLDNGGNLQQFVVPTGATRFYIGIMDEKGWWWDNTGYIQTTMMDTKAALVK